jgi:hypothetical protein
MPCRTPISTTGFFRSAHEPLPSVPTPAAPIGGLRLLALSLFVACSGSDEPKNSQDTGGNGGAEGSADGGADGGAGDGGTEDTTPRIDYLIGSSQYFDTSGAPRGPSSETWLRRTLDPAARTLEERVYTRDAGEVASFTLNGFVDPDAGAWTFSFSDDFGTIEGTGTFLEGEVWDWTAWQSQSEYVDGEYLGFRILSNDSITETELVAHKSLIDPAGDPMGTVEEVLQRVDAATWDAAVAGW